MFTPDVCLDVCPITGTSELSAVFPKAKHVIFESSNEKSADLKKFVKKNKCELIKTVIESSSSTNPEKIDGLALHLTRGRKVLMRVQRLGQNNEVLMGAKEVLKDTDVVIIKTPLYNFRGKTQADFFDIVEFMRSQGFVVFDMLGGLFKNNNRALGIIDLVFVKDVGPLRPNHVW